MEKKFVAWRRVSTAKQGVSGLGLQAQSDIISYFVSLEKGELIADFHEVFTGKDLAGCVELRKAMACAKENGAVLIIAKTDRFRNTSEALKIYEEMGDGNIYFCDLPHTDKFTLTLFFALAEREAKITSIRTRQALRAKKEQGHKLGNAKGVDLSRANEASARARRERAKADPGNRMMWEWFCESSERSGGGAPSTAEFARLADRFNRMGLRTSTGLEFTAGRARSAYHNQIKYMED